LGRVRAEPSEDDVQYAGLPGIEEKPPDDDDRKAGQHIGEINRYTGEAFEQRRLGDQQGHEDRDAKTDDQRPEDVHKRILPSDDKIGAGKQAPVIFQPDIIDEGVAPRGIQRHADALKQRLPDEKSE
jgi:hypothetical protein